MSNKSPYVWQKVHLRYKVVSHYADDVRFTNTEITDLLGSVNIYILCAGY